MKPQLEALAERKKGAVLRVVDIKSWSSEAARQHGIRRIPQLWLYDGTKLVSRDSDATLEWLSQ